MATTLTSTAYLALPKAIHAGVNSISFNITSGATSLSASANATIILGPRIPNTATILDITGQHSSGSDSMPVDIGIDTSLSKFSSQKTQATRATVTGVNLPFKVSVTDNAAAQYRTVVFGVTPGTDTKSANFRYTVSFTQDP